MAKGRIDEAYEIIKRIAWSNGRSIPESHDMFFLEKTKELQRDQMLGFEADDEIDKKPALVILL
jgi:hypothetical protein